ncbi:MAG: hypothetical protein ACI8PZ_004267 [Myxococcota bacterium]|jgi:hypothetical protein
MIEIPLALVFVVVGLVVTVAGERLVRVALALAGFALGWPLGLSLGGLVHPDPGVHLAVAVLVGLIAAFAANASFQIGVALIGAVAAVVGGLAALAALDLTAPAWAPVPLAVGGGLLAHLVERPVLAGATAVIGAWAVVVGGAVLVFGADDLVGLLPNRMPPPAAAAVWAVLAVVGWRVQVFGRGRRKDRGEAAATPAERRTDFPD